jgi:acyl-CoA synthetase (AMP-forming)/AMP-acid ligase II
LQFVVAFLAVIRCRATAAPLNSAYTAEDDVGRNLIIFFGAKENRRVAKNNIEAEPFD